MSGEHEHGHDHHHDHGHGDDELRKLRARIEHWAQHNREHQQSLEEWGARSGEMGLSGVSGALTRSAARMAESVAELEKALNLLQ